MRVVFTDTLFHWPPTGGSWVDLHAVMNGLQRRGVEVYLVLLTNEDYFQRGRILTDPGVPYQLVPISRRDFAAKRYTSILSKVIEPLRPDLVFIGDGYFLKPDLVNRLAADYAVILRFYSHEIPLR